MKLFYKRYNISYFQDIYKISFFFIFNMILTKFDDILSPLLEIWSILDYKNIDARNKFNIIIKNKKLIHNFDDDIDNGILHALREYDNLNTFILFGKSKNNAYKYYIEHFSKDYFLYGIKHINIDRSNILKIMYQLLFPRLIMNSIEDLTNHIKENYEYLSNYTDDLIDITLLIICKRNLNKNYPKNDIIQSNYCIYIPNTKEEILHASSVFFSNTTLKFLSLQDFNFFLIKERENSKKMFLKYRKWLISHVGIKEQSQYMLYSSVVLYLLGHREMNDLDLYIHTISDELQEITKQLSTDEKYNYIDYSIKGTEKWPKYWNTWLDEWARNCGAKYFEDILGNPKYHFYFLGVKIISLDCDIKRRLLRNRPKAYADLIALRKRYSYRINIPRIPMKFDKYTDVSDKSEEEIFEFVKKGGTYNEVNQEISIEYDTDVDKFIDTIIHTLKSRFRMTFTVNEIKRELNMPYDSIEKKSIQIKITKKEPIKEHVNEIVHIENKKKVIKIKKIK